jgi:hypothetical protein
VPFISTEPRYRMVEPLLSEGALGSANRAGVLERLGPPDATNDFERSCTWLLRREPAYAAELLVVRFDAQGRVERAQHVRGEWY